MFRPENVFCTLTYRYEHVIINASKGVSKAGIQEETRMKKKNVIELIVLIVALAVIYYMNHGSSFTCYYCGKTKTGTRHMVYVGSVQKPFCDSCYSFNSSIGNIK